MSSDQSPLSSIDKKMLAVFRDGDLELGTDLLTEEYGNLIYSVINWPRWGGRFKECKEELFHDIVMALIKNEFANFEGRSKLSTFIARVSHFQCVSRMRKMERREMKEVFMEDLSREDGPVYIPHSESQDDPVRNLIRNEHVAFAHEMLHRLGERCKKVFVLRFVEDLSYREIAEELETTTNDIGKRIHQCKAKARDLGVDVLQGFGE